MRPLTAPPWLRDLAGAWIFYTVLPAWPRLQPRFERIARFAPWIGLLQGLLQGLLWCLAEPWLPGGARLALVLALGLWLTGGIHADGVMDTADGLAAGERALEAMDDSRVGASGVLALVQVLLLRAAALLTLAELNLGPLVALGLVWAGVWGRIAPLLAMHLFPYLRPAGTAAFHQLHWLGLGRELRPALVLLVPLTLAGASMGWPWQGLLGLLPAWLVPLGLGRRLGGHSGDSYGACVEWVESLTLLLLALAALVAGAG
ncbi:adenosylcobinamide-GDP ribazoletransferase [Synechococcus sp. Cruz-9H2]|uniref:adenosylcobinamide-GDP ribazoletransferase n=1 Tax=unclassified Synechococcus TaxID=2626047 RepID=UPI0020CE3B2A|nr:MULTISPECIES: adenosylcobinamide-GDP ribazoletransferase [unclassified Synechococcus]MCP9819317.1 adenosylcobinamide-GDP ribazoletransferase [Synechococcus sp. Cruz-9H2]MCP9843110.1 adenosylcobinamide-GDP ribazoletransferase [Synechococcus sp. Edmonson 11F2]MCP9854855.1 adenosylcobinamide-GDP ribazoletransferase [Synechococcus sp. Cruz-9C9]MCP9862674.1 adenosylcobinamide-GDP ribazoletransferase [Synechococcus sp. Cruz-7E5]MCP9870227.1 adenosylcobinamide-GDP ribazoletransferase [Synechococcu